MPIKNQNPLNTLTISIHGDSNMAQLSSPGVAVTVIDESFYTPAAPGTVPLIIVASEEGKQNGAGTGTAAGTLKANAGQVYLLTSQKDLSDTFGTPVFKTDANNNPVHAGEQNEYGLQAAYSYLGVSNRAYVVRADIDTSQLDASADAPAGEPVDGTYWVDTASTKFGVFEWNGAAATTTHGQTFTNKIPTIITATNKVDEMTGAPLSSIGAVGDYAIVSVTTSDVLFFKNTSGMWVEVGTPEWTASWPTATANGNILNGVVDLTIQGGSNAAELFQNPTNITSLVAAINNNANLSDQGISAANVNNRLTIYSDGTSTNVTIGGTAAGADYLNMSGTFYAPALQISKHTQVPAFKKHDAHARPTGSVWVKTTTPNLGAHWFVKRYNAAAGSWIEQAAPLYASGREALESLDPTGGGINLALNTLYVKYNETENTSVPYADFKLFYRSGVGVTTVKSNFKVVGFDVDDSVEFTIEESVKGSTDWSSTDPIATVAFTATGTTDDAATLASQISAAGLDNVSADYDAGSKILTITHKLGGDIRLVDLTIGGTLSKIITAFDSTAGGGLGNVSAATKNVWKDPEDAGNSAKYVVSMWSSTVISSANQRVGFAVVSTDAPTTIPADGRLWYNSIVDEVDIMIHDGSNWVGYANYDQTAPGGDPTDPNGPIVSATRPETQSDGTPLGNGDLWIDTSDLENFPRVYKYNITLSNPKNRWVLVDNSDQTTEDGILFHDARWGVDGGTSTGPTDSTIVDLLSSDFLDFDAPDPALYPKGMLLWNLRRSGFNVKRFVQNYVDTVNGQNHRMGDELMTEYYPHRWLSEAANQADGSGTFGRKAQRAVVVQKLQALVNSNQQIRDEESRVFNLLACPGYPELVGELVSLNYDRGLTAFVVADTPARLTPDATSLSNWGNNVNGALEDNDKGLVSSDEYLGFFYPWGYTSDNIGNNVVVPPSHMILRTIALSDNVSYPWFAPAGTRRGGITNATSVGYVTSEGEFKSVALNNGQRDTLASVKVNPITFITGTGLVNYGQYTRAKNASALDRINVARLVIYLRRQFSQLAKPYVFEPNDKITRDEIKGAANSLLLELVGQRALYDFLVVCDETNNTPSRIDRNELYLDVAIEPVKAVEFIYIPLRLKNTGEIKGLG